MHILLALMSVAFKLAPMTPGLRALAWSLYVMPLLFLLGALFAPPPANAVMLASTAFIALLYASVWLLFRPSGFEVDAQALRIVWPMRSREIARADIESARIVTSAEFRSEYGYGMRIGVGGLWGGFGLLKCGRETFSMWISRTDRYVIVRVRGARPLLVTPALPERFVEIVTASPTPHVS